MSEEVDPEVLDGIRGHRIEDCRIGNGGLHMELDDGRYVVFALVDGLLVIGVYGDSEHVIH